LAVNIVFRALGHGFARGSDRPMNAVLTPKWWPSPRSRLGIQGMRERAAMLWNGQFHIEEHWHPDPVANSVGGPAGRPSLMPRCEKQGA